MPRKKKREPWKTSLHLWQDQRDELEVLAIRARRGSGLSVSVSEVMRAALDVALAELRRERFGEMTDPAEDWLRKRIARR